MFVQTFFTMSHIFNSLLGVQKCGQTQSFVFDINITSDLCQNPPKVDISSHALKGGHSLACNTTEQSTPIEQKYTK